MVDNSIGIDADTRSSARLDHVFEFFTCATATLKLVRGGLVVEPPWVELAVLWPLIGEDGLRDWEDLDSHPALLGQVRALFLDIVVRPAEHLNNCSFLTVLIGSILLNRPCLPDKTHWFKSDGVIRGAVVGLDLERQWRVHSAVNRVRVSSGEVLTVPIVGQLCDAGMLTAACRHRGTCPGIIVLNMVVAHDAAETLVLFLVEVGPGQVCLEGALGPIVGVRRDVARGAPQVIEVGAVVGGGKDGEQSCASK